MKIDRLSPKYWCFQQSLVYFSISCCGPTPGLTLQQKYGNWVLDVLKYDSADGLIKVIDDAILKPALDMSEKLLHKKAEAIRFRHVSDYKDV